MPRRKARTLTEVELEFMQVLWDEGEASTEAVQEALRRRGRELADGSVRKVLAILITKGYVTRRREGRAHLYRATVPQQEARHSLVADLLGRDDLTFEDLRIPTAVVAADVETGAMVVLDSGPLIPALMATSAFNFSINVFAFLTSVKV